ncbi:MAG: hypothetical protein L0211_18535 [Planctomycetaceae bacterium]|nr:hypothetical protein [Planctomycetaceae bacterium]
MKLRSTSMISVAFAATVCLALRISSGDEPGAPETERDNRVQIVIDACVERYRLLPASDAQRPLDPQVAIRWRNPTRGGQANAILVLWVHDGRPAAAASVFALGQLCHEFVSLSRTAGLLAYEGNELVWSPSAAGLQFQDVTDAPTPAESPVARLRQMKGLVRRFSATLTGWKSSESRREELRLLPQQLYRYDMKAAESTHPELRDGAMFAFVQGTDPEVMLLLEAVAERDRPPRWQYAFARATSGGLEAQLDGKLVWKVEQLLDDKSSTNPQIVLRRVIPE